jgi:hypothetical protein
MATSLTLIDGEEQRVFTEHPIETAKRALLEAAELEGDEWAALCRRIASTLPNRAPKVCAEQKWNRSPEQQKEWERKEKEWREADEAWRRMPAAGRESLLLGVLGAEMLIIRELVSRMNAELGYPSGGRARAVCEGNVRSLVTRMHRAGQLEREAETFNKTHTRYRYFRKHALDAPEAVA